VNTRIAYLDGEFIPHEDAKVSIASHVVNYGTGCFEGIRAYWNAAHGQLYATLLEEHSRRLVRSAVVLNLELGLEPNEVSEVVLELLRRNELREDAYIRPLAYKADETITVTLGGIRTAFAAYCQPMGAYLDIERGLRLMYSSWRRIDDNAVPARAKAIGSYINAALASDDARRKGFDEALMLTGEGHVAEASSSNVFFVFGGEVHTPVATDDILVGITRQAVISMAETMGLKIFERHIDRSETFFADEAFLCGTGVQIAPVTEIDGRAIGGGRPGPITGQLQSAYLAAVRGESQDFSSWRTPVYPS
jgi:branched-chain amino acid aminotransferase